MALPFQYLDCRVVGLKTEDEALENIEAAIREYLEGVDGLIGDSTVREIEIAV
jgi:hypothetical protein